MKYRGITIKKHPNCSTWYARARINGKQVYISGKTQKECYEKLKLTLQNKNSKALTAPQTKCITLLEWYNEWLKSYKSQVQITTKLDYKNSFSYLENLHNLPLNKITSLEIIKTLNLIEQPRQKQKVYEFAKMLFKPALELKTINNDIMCLVPKPEYKRKPGKAFDEQDEKKFIEISKKNNLDMFLVGIYQGLRRGEILGLTYKDVDFVNKTLTIDKSWTVNNTFGPTKNNSDRIMPLFDKTIKILEKYKGKDNERIFDFEYRKCGKIFNNIVNNYLNYKKYTPKAMRYTFITIAQENNIPLHIIQEWVGHKIGSTVTTKVYTTKRNNVEIKCIEKINKLNSN